MAITEENGEEPSIVLDSNHIISDAYTSFDRQIEKLDIIPINAKAKTHTLLLLLFSGKDIFRVAVHVFEFIEDTSDLSVEIGEAFLTVLETELATQRMKTEVPIIPMPQMPTQQFEKPNPNIVLQTQPQKGGGFWDFQGARAWSKTVDRIFALQKNVEAGPQITTSKVMQVIDYGRELISEWNKTFDFYNRGIDHLYFFGDPDTYERQHKQLAFHLVKLCNIINTFSTTITEYRKERFGDRKASVASGVLWLEGAKAQSNRSMSVADYYRAQRLQMGGQDVGER